MIRSTLLIWAGTLGVVGVALGVTIAQASHAHVEAAREQARVHEVARDAETIAESRINGVDVSVDDTEHGGLASRVAAAIQRAGLPASALSGLSPEAESPIANQQGVRVARHRATLTLAGVSLPQAGAFLDVWRATQPAWTPVSIDIAPAEGKAPEAGGDLPLRVIMVIESVVVPHEGARP